MVEDSKRNRDKIDQLLRRLDLIVYHYKDNDEYKTFSIPASEYTNYENLKQRALSDGNGFMQIHDNAAIPFEQ